MKNSSSAASGRFVRAIPAIRDRAVIEAKRMVVRVIVQVIASLLEGIADLDKKIEAAAAHPDFAAMKLPLFKFTSNDCALAKVRATAGD